MKTMRDKQLFNQKTKRPKNFFYNHILTKKPRLIVGFFFHIKDNYKSIKKRRKNMGWTSIYEKDKRAAEAHMLSEFEWRNEKGDYHILKKAKVGTTYYLAIENKISKDTFCAVVLTSYEDNSFYWKSISENSGPYECNCPESILKVLSETDDELAIKWRNSCRKASANKKLLQQAPDYSIIAWDGESKAIIMPPSHQFKTRWFLDIGGKFYIKKKNIPIEKDIKIIQK